VSEPENSTGAEPVLRDPMLKRPGAFVDARKLARLFVFTKGTISTHVKAEMPIAGKGRKRLFDRAVCERRREQNKPVLGRGGMRNRAGKKAAGVPQKAADDPVTEHVETGEVRKGVADGSVVSGVRGVDVRDALGSPAPGLESICSSDGGV